MTRKEAREEMMKIIFQMDAQNDYDPDSDDGYIDPLKPGRQGSYMRQAFALFCEHHKDIDKAIKKNCRKWELSRMPRTDIAILRLACTEILYMEDVPHKVSVNEAVELAKRYGDDNSPSYINGILGSVVRGLE